MHHDRQDVTPRQRRLLRLLAVALGVLVMAGALWLRPDPGAPALAAGPVLAGGGPPQVFAHQHETWQRKLESGGRVLVRQQRDAQILREHELTTLGRFSPAELGTVRQFFAGNIRRQTEKRIAFWESVTGPAISMDQLLAEATIGYEIELNRMALQLLDAGEYWTVAPNAKLPPRPLPDLEYSRLCGLGARNGEVVDIVFVFDRSRFPDYRRAGETVAAYRSLRVEDFARAFNALDEVERRSRHDRHRAAMTALSAGQLEQEPLARDQVALHMGNRFPDGLVYDDRSALLSARR